jgi:hypothetical protein
MTDAADPMRRLPVQDNKPNAQTTAKTKREAQDRGVRFGCYIDIKQTNTPDDDCVLDYGDVKGCPEATRHRSREGCPFWRPI